MDWKPWQGEATLKAARWLTNRLRQGDDPPSFARLRRALQGWGLDPEQSVLSELFPDGGSDFGILIRPDGVPCVVDIWWGAEDQSDEGVELRPLVQPDQWQWSAHGEAIHAGWTIHMEEGRGQQDLLSALVPGIRYTTASFRDGDTLVSQVDPGDRDWSLANQHIANEGVDPSRVMVLDSGDRLSGGPGRVFAIFVFPDKRVFSFEAESDARYNPVRIIEWRQLTPIEVTDDCGPLYHAAIRLLDEENDRE